MILSHCYLILDKVAENVSSSFFGPNDDYALRVFSQFLKNHSEINSDDMLLVKGPQYEFISSYDDAKVYPVVLKKT